MFHVGQKVVCIDASGIAYRLSEGTVYTVARLGGTHDTSSDKYLQVAEIAGAWFKRRFKPLVSRPTDISTFTRILDEVNAHTRTTEKV